MPRPAWANLNLNQRFPSLGLSELQKIEDDLPNTATLYADQRHRLCLAVDASGTRCALSKANFAEQLRLTRDKGESGFSESGGIGN